MDMTSTDVTVTQDFAELELPDSCPSCSGAMDIRVTVGMAWAVCLPCQAITRFEVEDDDEKSLSLTPVFDAEA